MMTALLMMCSDGVVPRRPSVVVYCPPVPIRCCSMVTARALSSIMQRQGYLSPCAICHCIDRVTPVDLIARHLPIIVQYCPARAYGQSPNSSRISKNIRMHWVEGLSCCSLLSLEKNFCACRFQSLELVCNSSTYIFDKPCFDAGTYLHLPKCQYFFLFSGNCFFRIGALVEKRTLLIFCVVCLSEVPRVPPSHRLFFFQLITPGRNGEIWQGHSGKTQVTLQIKCFLKCKMFCERAYKVYLASWWEWQRLVSPRGHRWCWTEV